MHFDQYAVVRPGTDRDIGMQRARSARLQLLFAQTQGHRLRPHARGKWREYPLGLAQGVQRRPREREGLTANSSQNAGLA